jgi:hypothetical protein
MGNCVTATIKDFSPSIEETGSTAETFSGRGLAVCVAGGCPHMVLTFQSCEPLEIELPLPVWKAQVDLASKGTLKPWVQSHMPTLVVIDVNTEQWDHLFDLLGPFSSKCRRRLLYCAFTSSKCSVRSQASVVLCTP